MTALLGVREGRRPAADTVTATQRPLTGHPRVAVWGVKGGVGTTTLALLLGTTLARHRPEPVVVADDTLYGSLALRAGMSIPAEPVIRPATAEHPAIAIGCAPPAGAPLAILDAPAPGQVDADVLVVTAAADAVLMADGHAASLVVLTQPARRSAIDLDAATARLQRAATRVLTLPYDPHLAVGGPVAWDRLAPATRDACRDIAAQLISVLCSRPSEPTPME